ncbi:hypothetical protein H9660_03515 [Clostridium sp. Sa3CUN1]|uniref:Uncharacterized protein n=1 Tax=Clostridium gallinarum TaxID=2762246 RepID=A0ABR8Q1B6_9CLOT|nr:hypothetical protein [Clostridium gallinarum]MBD7914206.1 hypothetical protein [Clostridium gallinarum]
MEEVKRIAATTLTDTETELYKNSNGSIVKTILLYNSNSSEKQVTLNLDGVTFLFTLNSNEFKVIDTPIMTNSIKGKGQGVNIHITGIQLGGA